MKSTHVPESVKKVVHLGSRSVGWLTSGARMLPSFLICGGQRCGTTSLYRAMAAHPAVLKAVLHKGVHYFDTSYHRGLAWYQGHFPLRRTATRVERELGVPVQTFESSPYYLYHPHAAGRIARDLPGVKLIVLVRDPVERAYSQHAHELARGFETTADFAAALDLEPARLRGQRERMLADQHAYSFSHQHHGYRARGEYAVYLRRLVREVPRERILVLESERFFTDPAAAYDQVLDFLGLPLLGYPDFGQHNARPRTAPMPARLRTELRAHYAPHDAELAQWLGHTPSWRE
ncbi:sulfotransferase domain-containing protein [Catellatospora sp. KI3]|uniref:sulfotransferase family protein n=1 Tax=Catellatospora sp. KI3 TaxID=3041620 RepID=UPI0024822FCB|nr:sulfotransferase domain-containing protein [Catellatospora sp. KI3]MDI1460383.1 sulfotransferase domain-containing protein [Catellatospora sp. KI3]